VSAVLPIAFSSFTAISGVIRLRPAIRLWSCCRVMPRPFCGIDNRNADIVERIANQLAGVGWIFISMFFLPVRIHNGAIVLKLKVLKLKVLKLKTGPLCSRRLHKGPA